MQNMPMTDQKTEDTFTKVQRVIAESTGHDIEEITLDTDFEDDLGLDADTDFPNLIPAIKMEFREINLSNQEILNCATVAELVERIDDELF